MNSFDLGRKIEGFAIASVLQLVECLLTRLMADKVVSFCARRDRLQRFSEVMREWKGEREMDRAGCCHEANRKLLKN
jgi:hypothetical protein